MRLTMRLFPLGMLLLLPIVAADMGCRTTKPIPHSPRTGELSVKPGINDKLAGDNVDKWVARFEGESREIYSARESIAKEVGVKPGMVVADIGAGTGFIAELFARQVQPGGRVYAVDIVPGFLELIRKRAREHKLDNIETVLCTEDSVDLPLGSIDLAFVCDTYHHFEYPRSTMATLHAALRPGGEVVIVDFIRDRNKSRAWIINHVRAGQDTVIREIESDGFELVDRGDDIPYLNENYMMRFRKTE